MAQSPSQNHLADLWHGMIGTPVQSAPARSLLGTSMSPASADVSQTPEPKSTSGLASVFKSLTGSRSAKSSSNQSSAPNANAQLAQQLHPNAGKNAIYGGPPNYKQLYEQLRGADSIADRISAAEALRHVVAEYPLAGVMNIWFAGNDLIEPTKPAEARVAGFELLSACVRHSASSDLERKEFFDTLTAPANQDDFHLQLTSVVELANHGRDLSGFQYEALPLINSWLRDSFLVTTSARKQAAAAGRQNRSLKSKAPLGEETNLSLLFAFVVDIIKFSFNVSNEETTNDLINIILHICVHTPLSGDLRSCINVLDAIVTYGAIPGKKLLECVKVLCSIHCLVEDVQPEAWRSISNLCRSHDGQTTVRYLLNILRQPNLEGSSDKQTIREIRGALSVLEKLFAKDGENGYPLVPFTLLMDGLKKVMAIEHAKVETDILKMILSLFNNEQDEVMENVMEEDWNVMFEVASKCAQRASETSDGRLVTDRSRMASPLAGTSMAKEEALGQNVATSMAQTLYSLIMRIEQLLNTTASGEFFQRDDCIAFFVSVQPHLPESCAKLVIDYYIEYRLCYPSDSEWKENVRTILSAFFAARIQPTHIRLHALKAVTDVFDIVEMMDQEDPDCVETFVTAILDDIGEERDVAVLQEVVSFSVAVAESVDIPLFDYVVNAINSIVASDRLQSPLGSPPSSRHGLMSSSRPASSTTSTMVVQTPSNVVTKGLVQIFMKTMDKSPVKSLRVFDLLLEIVRSNSCETDARISAMKMLFRLRADWANRIFLTPFTEADGLAASLYRTPASLARKQAVDEASQQNRVSRADEAASSRLSRSVSISQGHPQARQPVRLGSGVYRALQRNHQMWMTPDPDALPEPVSGKASPSLTSIMESDDQVVVALTERKALNIGTYLDTMIILLESGCDWEVYSYVLVHLASQLTNQALFKDAIPQIRTLRALLCEQLKNSSFFEPPVSSGLRKVDVAICLFQILTMVMSYHGQFSPQEEDDIVRTFVQGVGTERASKCCIHALSICCHELPRPTSKALASILQKMSQIITQSYVAVHILEFLACLSRLQNLYNNFRDDEYRTVFGICFRYLQYVRDHPTKDTTNRNSNPHTRTGPGVSEGLRGVPEISNAESNFQPNTSDDLPQYVYALAYHVITFWFLSMKLPDRAPLVSWITKNLIFTDINGKEQIDEQAQITLDFMQRVAYADVDESAPDPNFTAEVFGEILKKRWIIGNSIVTIEQATRGEWAQITKRQPSGTSCYVIRERFSRPPIHQSLVLTDATRSGQDSDSNVVLPSHLLLQLAASIPQTGDLARPIALPDDDTIRRAISTFDRNSTVDGHKIGVVYIGENQTDEVEILANVMGSSDYTEFLTGLGTLTRLKGATFNAQGLDRTSDTDGEYTFCWRDRVTEIVFHVTTQMPTDLSRDAQCIMKKRHIGNDFVNIIFNNSGLPFRFDTFPSEFNYVNIVITPESRASFVATRLRTESYAQNAFFKVQVMSKPGFPEISPAAETKILSLAALPAFIRLLALNASVFSLVWFNREGGEHISPWRSRLRQITQLRERHGKKQPATSPPSTANSMSNMRDSINSLGRRSSVANYLTNNTSEQNSQRSSVLSTAETEVAPGSGEGNMIDGLDFSRWA
ncbi:Tuberous sclerosis 2-like protein [Phlyctema vagabunda]|uniref:Tuberous sclerosis 2-like protein n=1 Tax=Phlyctema vagabunda TaxID=108571 RepID=A0ABR4PQN5_9HELO